jgi:hypothetical protein
VIGAGVHSVWGVVFAGSAAGVALVLVERLVERGEDLGREHSLNLLFWGGKTRFMRHQRTDALFGFGEESLKLRAERGLDAHDPAARL